MMHEIDRQPLKTKSKLFAIRIVNLYRLLSERKNEHVLSKQLLRSGTSVGANIAESECAMSKKDFLAKIYIALKECNETLYWIELLHDTHYINDAEFLSIQRDCMELKKMLAATIKTTVRNLSS